MRGPALERPYRRSWVDRLTESIERLPGPTWLPYVLAFIALLVVGNASGWLDGSGAPGRFDTYLSSLPVYPVAALAAIHYLDAEAGRALDRLRPALPGSDDDFISLRYRLTTLPAGPTLIWTVVGLVFAVAYTVLGLESSLRSRGAGAVAFDVAIALIGFPLLAVLFFHTVRQLRLISRIVGRMATIDVFHLDPLLRFSGVTARSGMILLGLGYLGVATDPSTFILAKPTLITFVLISALVGIAAFVLPLVGMHARIVEEKERLAADANRDLQAALAELSRRVRAGKLTDADALNKQLSSLVIQRDVIARIQTWPWQPGTLRAFATAVLLPVVLWVFTRVLDRLLG